MLMAPNTGKRWEKGIEGGGGDELEARQHADSSTHRELEKNTVLTAGTASRRGTRLSSGTFAVTAKNARIGEQRLEHGVPPWERLTTMFISDYVVKSPPITVQTRPSGRLHHIVKFAT